MTWIFFIRFLTGAIIVIKKIKALNHYEFYFKHQ